MYLRERARGYDSIHLCWRIGEPTLASTPQRFPGFETDALVIMPNHIHGILVLDGLYPGRSKQRPYTRSDHPNV